jgi:hypothetical protein
MTQQGDRIRKYAQDKARDKMQPSIQVGTMVIIKLDNVDRGNLDHKSVPGVACEVREQDNYRIVCKDNMLKDSL